MLEPFLKWPGGKRWLARRYGTLFPTSYARYLEPFLGGGAIFFHLLPRRAILSDTNEDLVNVYACLRTYAKAVDRLLRVHHRRHDEEFYYRIREARPTDPVDRAVRFLYLNRTCFNGMYRVNLKGEFNVPIGTKTLVAYPRGYLETTGRCLRRVSIKRADFEETIDGAVGGDFIFADPPYTVTHNNNNFLKYNSRLFSWPDQVRLAAALRRAAARGAKFMVCNADHRCVRELYAGLGTHHKVSRTSVLAAVPSLRRETTELVITNYAGR